MTTGVFMIGGGIIASGTVAGAPAGIGLISLGAPTFGFGLGKVIDGFQGGDSKVPGGFFEAVDIGVGGDGSTGQIMDVVSGGLPDNAASWLLMGYSISKLNIMKVSYIIPAINPYPATQPRDNTNIFIRTRYPNQ